MMTGGLLARYLSPAMGSLRHTEQGNQRAAEHQNQEEPDRYYTATGNNNSSSCRPPPSPRLPLSSTETQSVSEFSPCSSSISSSSSPSSSVPSSLLFDMPCWVSSAASSGSSLMTCRNTDSYNEYFSNNNSNSYTKNRTNTISSKCSRRRRDDVKGGGRGEDGSSSYYTCSSSSSSHISATRFPPLFLIPLILLLIVSNQGIVRHVQGQQVWSDPHHTAAGFGQQYASFEELQRLTENPFENNTAVNVTVPLGDNAFLRCKVRNLGERSISWVRRRDWHILTSGKTTYTNDERFHVLHADGSDDWTLQIKFVQKRDNGTYECQVSTGTGIVSYLVHLRVTVPEVFILGNGEYHVEQGSTISLVCVIEKSPKPPEYIFWYHNQRMINYGSSREVKVINEPGSKTHSRLTIRDAQISDSGNYTCETAHAEPASTLVYVSQGDQIAAIQKRKAAAAASSTSHVANSALPSSRYHVAPIKLYLAISIINLTLLVPFLLSQYQQKSPLTVSPSPSKLICSSSSHNHNHHNQRQHLSQDHHKHLRLLMQHQQSRQYSQLVH